MASQAEPEVGAVVHCDRCLVRIPTRRLPQGASTSLRLSLAHHHVQSPPPRCPHLLIAIALHGYTEYLLVDGAPTRLARAK